MKKPRFVLSRKNQKGQVAIFVALIFQVIFVFFALLINVGLLVHHKINLQQSTDLAAYYGAMKQAESLNAIAHINFQIKQAWKLLTWRYRVVGTFGFQGDNTAMTFPLTLGRSGASEVGVINGANSNSQKCPVGTEQLNTNDLPFFCIGHRGMRGWPNSEENICILNCGQLSGVSRLITKIPGVGSAMTPNGGTVSGAVGAAITKANATLDMQCKDLGPKGLQLMARFLASYYLEERARSKTLLMLAANISKSDQDTILDLDGNPILDGVKNTLKNNLTEANKVSLIDGKIKIINGLSDINCRMSTDEATSGSKKGTGQFLKRIEYSFLQFYIHKCSTTAGAGARPGDLNYAPGSIFNPDGTAIDPILAPSPELNDLVMALELNDNQKFTTGYEKNPWCQSYYSVKAESEPKIPFLPISKIKLTAISVAKPFGGSIGPWFGKEWKNGDSNSQDAVGVDTSKQLDVNLPLAAAATTSTLKDNIKKLPNFSRYVGDALGLADGNYLAEYHAALVEGQPTSSTVNYGGSKAAIPNPGNGKLSPPTEWPSLDSWEDAAVNMSNSAYDPLAKGSNHNDSYLRDLEISAIAPNQFDLTYYSIDPDFYNNYYSRLSDRTIFDKLKRSAGIGPDDVSLVRADFGNNASIYPNQKPFAVRNQIEIVAKTFNKRINVATQKSGIFLDSYKELATRQSSLLTGWTFFSLSDYGKFPDADVTSADGSMSFGRCVDKWQGTDGAPSYGTPMDIDKDLPPTPGNCVTGGRVGYSVKLVSPSLLRGNAPPQPLGGVNTNGQIINPIPDSFFNF